MSPQELDPHQTNLVHRLLPVLYSVWVNQLWYWQNVRPQLQGRKVGWIFFLRATIETLVLASLLCGILILCLWGWSGKEIEWFIPFTGAVAGIVLGILISGFSGIVAGVATAVVRVSTLAITLAFIGGLAFSLDNRDVVTGVGMCGISVAVGIDQGTITGRNPSAWLGVGFVLVALLLGQTPLITRFIIGIITGVGFYAGHRWAVRQLPDETKRQSLADPERLRLGN